MERHEILKLMGELSLAGMRHAYDDVMADGIKRQYEKAKQTAVETEIRRLGAGNSLPRIPAPPSRLPATVVEQPSIPVQRREPSLPIDSSSIYNASEPVLRARLRSRAKVTS